MNADAYRFEFQPHVSLSDAEESLHLALFAVEGIFGRAQVRLDARYELDETGHAVMLDTTTLVGETVLRVFTGLLLREFSEDAFSVRRADSLPKFISQERTVTV
ncbi:MAG: hypothetical protein WD066_17320 [Planctomycetaceae bacterium]